jgi:Lipid A 3-O-deacylase (PagL)
MLSTPCSARRIALLTVIAIVSPALIAAQDAPSSTAGAVSATEQPAFSPSPEPLSRGDAPAEPNPAAQGALLVRGVTKPRLPDFNRNIYYKNKLEFSLETGWLPNNIPFVFDFIVGSTYNSWPLHYTLVPNIASVRWQLDNIWGWKLFRGNTDFSFSGSYTAIPRGAETRYFAFDYGIRRNFIPPRWRVVPYVEGRGGIGNINAKGPYGVRYAQGQDMTFTLMVGSGARYNFGPRYAVSGGMTYMHVSNFYLSEPRYEDVGINVYGTIVGVYMRLGKPKPDVVP